MAPITWYGTTTNANASGDDKRMDEAAPAPATSGTGWTVGTTASSNFSQWIRDSERLASTFGAGAVPAAARTQVDGFRSENTYNGTFAAGNWQFDFSAIAVTAAGATGRVNFRLYRGTVATGLSGVTELTSSRQVGNIVSALATTPAQISTVTFAMPAVTLTDEYLFVDIGWEVTTAAGGATADVLNRVGNADPDWTRLISTDFGTWPPSGSEDGPERLRVVQSSLRFA